MNQNNKFINYARDDVFIISINNSADRIEECEAKIYIEPRNIFIYFGLISALYSKIHKYIDTKLDKQLEEIRNKLYNENLLNELNMKVINNNVKKKYIEVLDELTKVYRIMTNELPSTSLFPIINKKDNRPGAVRI